MEINKLIKIQRSFFETGKTLDLDFRISALMLLKNKIKENEELISESLARDLGKSQYESYVTEIGLVYEDINYHIKNLKKWASPKRVLPGLTSLPSTGAVYKEPLGIILIIAPWNYPFLLVISPLIAAIAAGNCAVLKPSEMSASVSKTLKLILDQCFPTDYIAVVEGDVNTAKVLLKKKVDHIFYTGNKIVAKSIMHSAAENLTPVTLELGGKSPCIIDNTALVDLAARRIAWGKSINSGQTCIAPDYVFVHNKKKKQFLDSIVKYNKAFFGEDPLKSKDLTVIINERHFDRLTGLLEGQKVYYGGRCDKEKFKIEPTIIVDPSLDSNVMLQEIFGPILPVIGFDDIEDVISYIKSNDKPLALYLFSRDKACIDRIIKTVKFGGGCINDIMMHMVNNRMPFGGVGESGMGAYNSKKGFDTFSHEKSVLKKSNKLDISLRYPPYEGKLKLAKRILK